MSLVVACAACKNELNTPGALLFGPPNGASMTPKFHLCTTHYVQVLDYIAYLGTLPAGVEPPFLTELTVEGLNEMKRIVDQT